MEREGRWPPSYRSPSADLRRRISLKILMYLLKITTLRRRKS
jgi:hypothetical protein